MELSAIIWPVYDDMGSVLRFFGRAYAIPGPDDLVSRTLRALAQQDYVLALQFPVPKRFVLSSEHGEIAGCTTVQGFNEYQFEIIDPALAVLEKAVAQVHGIAVDKSGTPYGIAQIPRFGSNPYLVFNFLHESANGRLTPRPPGS